MPEQDRVEAEQRPDDWRPKTCIVQIPGFRHPQEVYPCETGRTVPPGHVACRTINGFAVSVPKELLKEPSDE